MLDRFRFKELAALPLSDTEREVCLQELVILYLNQELEREEFLELRELFTSISGTLGLRSPVVQQGVGLPATGNPPANILQQGSSDVNRCTKCGAQLEGMLAMMGGLCSECEVKQRRGR